MSKWTIERQYLVPVFDHVVIDARTAAEACLIARGEHAHIHGPSWESNEVDWDNARPVTVSRIVRGGHGDPYEGKPLVKIPGEKEPPQDVILALWDFIENCTDEDPRRSAKFFKLRQRVYPFKREGVAS